MNQFMIGLVLVIIIIILISLLGALNKMYPENFFGTCLGEKCPVYGMTCNSDCNETYECTQCNGHINTCYCDPSNFLS